MLASWSLCGSNNVREPAAEFQRTKEGTYWTGGSSCQHGDCHAPHLSLSFARAPASFSLLITLLPVPVEKLVPLDAE